MKIPSEAVWNCLPSFVYQVFQRPAKEKELQLEVVNGLVPEVTVVAGENTQLCFRISNQGLENRACLLNSVLEIDTFSLIVPSYEKQISMYVYDVLFTTKSRFKQITLQVPETIVGGEQPIDFDVAENHTSVERLTIQCGRDTAIEPLLYRCSIAFCNLKLLTLDGFCGSWLYSVSKYQLDLTSYSLEKLVVNLLTLYQDKKDKTFIVIQVKVLSSGNKYLYKIPFGCSKATRMNRVELIMDIERGEDYDLIHLIVGSLRYLKLVKKLSVGRDEKLETKLDVELLSPDNE